MTVFAEVRVLNKDNKPALKFLVSPRVRRYNPKHISWVLSFWVRSGYAPVFLTLTAPHSPDGDIQAFNSRISRAFYFFLDEYLKKYLGRSFKHFLRRSEDHRTGHYHYHLLILDWDFTVRDYALVRLAWVHALRRAGLVGRDDLERAREYARRWSAGERSRSLYALGRSFGGFIKVEPLRDGVAGSSAVASYITAYMSDSESKGRLRGYGVFHNLVYAHSVFVFLRRMDIPVPSDDAPVSEWVRFRDEFVSVVDFLVGLKKSSLKLSPSSSLWSALRVYFLRSVPVNAPVHRGNALWSALLGGDVPSVVSVWLYRRRLSSGLRDDEGYTPEERNFTDLVVRDISAFISSGLLSAGLLRVRDKYTYAGIGFDADIEASLSAWRGYLVRVRRVRRWLDNVLDLLSSLFTYRSHYTAVYWTSPFADGYIPAGYDVSPVSPFEVSPAEYEATVMSLIRRGFSALRSRIDEAVRRGRRKYALVGSLLVD